MMGIDIQRILQRKKGINDFLKKENPNIFKDQRHLVKGSIERAYWHYGYMIALRDILNKLTFKEKEFISSQDKGE